MAKGEKVSKPAASAGVGWRGFLAGAAVAAVAIAAGLFHVYGYEGNAVSPHAQYVRPRGVAYTRPFSSIRPPGNWCQTQRR